MLKLFQTAFHDLIRTVRILFHETMGAVFLVSLIAILESKNKHVHLFSMIIVSVVIGFNLGLAFCMEYPFSGDMAVTPDAFKIESLQGFFEGQERAS